MEIPGYSAKMVIHNGENSTIIRATRGIDQLPVVLKVLNREFPSSEDIARFYMEYKILDDLNVKGVVNVLGVEELINTLVMVEEDLNIDSLQHWLQKNDMSIEGALNFTIKVTQILADIHNNKIIHNGMCPANLLWDAEHSIISVIDFSSATEMNEQASSSTLIKSKSMEYYMSPENTGRINALVDYRSDLYSIGVIMYKLLTGKTPLKSETLHELIYKKISITPKSPYSISHSIPLVLSNIVMKLLNKEPRSRYQTATGLLHDLKVCQHSLNKSQGIIEFKLAQHDIPHTFQISKTFCGRQEQLTILKETVLKLASGHKQVLLISGPPGIGKSAMVNEIISPLIAQQGYFITAKYLQYQSMSPYATIKKCLQVLNTHLQIEPWQSIVELKEELNTALQANGQIILDIVTDLEWLLGNQKPLPALKPIESKFRFENTIIRFIKAVARKCHPITLHIDDIQWADNGDMSLLEKIIEDPELKYLLVIFSYRDRELTNESNILSSIINNGISHIINIKLSPLNQQQLTEFIEDIFSSRGPAIDELTRVVSTKTQGNPFHAIQFLNKANHKGFFRFNKISATWLWNIDNIIAMDVCDNIVEDISNRISNLNDTDRVIIQAAALMDGAFNIFTLAMLCEQPYPKVITSIWSLIKNGYMVCVGTTINTLYKSCEFINDFSTLEKMKIARFSHDKILQAAYLSIPAERMQQLHLGFARRVFAEVSASNLKDESIIISIHYNKALDIIEDTAERIQVAKINLNAGIASRDKGDFKLSCQFFEAALMVFLPTCSATYPELKCTLLYEAAKSQFIFGDFERTVKHADKLILLTNDEILQTKAVKVKVLSYVAVGDISMAIDVGRAFLKQFNINIPELSNDKELTQQFVSETKKYNKFIQQPGFTIKGLEKLTTTTNQKAISVVDILSELIIPSFFTSKKLMHLLSILQVNLAIENGNCDAMPFAYSWWGLSLIYQKKYKQAIEFSTLAMNMANSHKMTARAYTGSGIFIDYHRRHILHSITILKTAAASAEQSNEITFATYCTTTYNRYAFYQGIELRKVSAESNTCLLKIKKWNVEALYDFHTLIHYSYLSLLGESPNKYILSKSAALENELLARWKSYNNNLHLSLYAIQQMILHYTYGDYTGALEFAIMAEENKEGTMPAYDYTHIAFYYPLILLELYPAANDQKKESYWSTINEYSKTLRIWSKHGKPNFLHKYLVVSAEKSRIKGDPTRAMVLYEEAITEANKTKFIQIEALANELYGKFLLSEDKDTVAAVYLNKSYYLYSRWGAVSKINQMEEHYGAKLFSNTSDRPNTTAYSKGVIDLDAVLRSSNTISQIKTLPELIKSILSIMLEYTGAHSCCCLLKHNGSYLAASKLSIKPSNLALQSYTLAPHFLTEMEEFNTESQTTIKADVASIPVPTSIIDYVTRSSKSLIIDEVPLNQSFFQDEYFRSNSVLSVLCKPIVSRGEVVAVLYLENSLLAGVFNEGHMNIVDALSLQISISLENSRLYSSLEKKVNERTLHLKETMGQLIEAEKMSSLAQLVSGVAHELNTPIGVCVTSATMLQHDNQGIKDQFINGEITKTDFAGYMDQSAESINLLLNNISRINNLIKIFKTTSVKSNVEEKEHFNLFMYLNEIAIGSTPNLENGSHTITIHCKDSINIVSYPRSFTLIINSLIANAVTHGFMGLKKREITIDVIEHGDSITVIFEDNGCGMSSELKGKIFDPFFTTNRSIGIGLGLHILFNVVTQKLKGKVICLSEIGKGTRFEINFSK